MKNSTKKDLRALAKSFVLFQAAAVVGAALASCFGRIVATLALAATAIVWLAAGHWRAKRKAKAQEQA